MKFAWPWMLLNWLLCMGVFTSGVVAALIEFHDTDHSKTPVVLFLVVVSAACYCGSTLLPIFGKSVLNLESKE